MFAQSQDCSASYHNLEPHRAFRLCLGCWAPPAFCSLCSVQFFPFFIFPIYFIFMDYKSRCNSNHCCSEKVQLVLQSPQEIPKGCRKGVRRVLPAQKRCHEQWWLTNDKNGSEWVNVLQSTPGVVQRCSLALLQLGQSGPETLCRFVPLFWSFPTGAPDPTGQSRAAFAAETEQCPKFWFVGKENYLLENCYSCLKIKEKMIH